MGTLFLRGIDLRRRWERFAIAMVVVGSIASCGSATTPASTPGPKHQTTSARILFSFSGQDPPNTDPATQIISLATGFPEHVLAARAQEVVGGTSCVSSPHGLLTITDTKTARTVMAVELCAKPLVRPTFDLPAAPAGYDFALEDATLASFNLSAIQ